MAITEWHTPIHECQKGEVAREWCYLEQYYPFYGNLKQYSELLQYAYDKKHKQNQNKTKTLFEDYLKDHPICFAHYDIENGKPPSYQQLRLWSAGQNTTCDEKYSWEDRRSSNRNEVNRLAVENLAAQMTDDLPYFYKSVKKGFKEVDEAVDNSKRMDNFTPHQAESATKGRGHVVDSLLKLLGKDKDYNVKADVEADVNKQTTVNNPGLNKIAEAYLNGRKQYNDESAR